MFDPFGPPQDSKPKNDINNTANTSGRIFDPFSQTNPPNTLPSSNSEAFRPNVFNPGQHGNNPFDSNIMRQNSPPPLSSFSQSSNVGRPTSPPLGPPIAPGLDSVPFHTLLPANKYPSQPPTLPINPPPLGPPTNMSNFTNMSAPVPSYHPLSQIASPISNSFQNPYSQPQQSVFPDQNNNSSNIPNAYQPPLNSENNQSSQQNQLPLNSQPTPVIHHKQYTRYSVKQLTSEYESEIMNRLDYDKRVKNSSLPRANQFPGKPPILLPSTNYVYTDDTTIENSKFPYCICLQPFTLNNDDCDIPKLNYVNKEIPRCRDCGAFFNPFQVQTVQGSICNLCNKTSDMGYFPYQDKYIYDIEVSSDYCEIKPPFSRYKLFIIENTLFMREHNYFSYIIQFISEITEPFLLVLVDTHIHFFYVKNNQLNEHLCHFMEPLGCWPLKEYVLEPDQNILKQLTEYMVSLRPVQNTQIIPFMVNILDITGDIKLHIIGFISEYIMKNNSKNNDSTLYVPTTYYVSEAKSEIAESVDTFLGSNIRFDLFCFTSYNDNFELKELSIFCNISGGNIYYYQNINVLQFHYDLYSLINSNIYYYGAIKVRHCTGMKVDTIFGNGHEIKQYEDHRTILSYTENTTFLVNFTINNKVKELFQNHNMIYYQITLLFGTNDDHYYIRVFNYSMGITNDITLVYNTSNEPVVVKYVLSQVIHKLMNGSIESAREYVYSYLTDLLSFYRQRCNPNAKSGQLLVPDSLRTILFYMISILKSPLLCKSASPTLRIYYYYKFLSVTLDKMLLSLCGYLQKTNLLKSIDEIPPSLYLSASSIDLDGTYFLYTGDTLYYLIGKDIPKQIRNDLHAIIDDQQTYEIDENNQYYDYIYSLLSFSREYNIPITLVEWNGPLENVFFSKLIEDKIDITGTYNDFICTIHAKIQEKIR